MVYKKQPDIPRSECIKEERKDYIIRQLIIVAVFMVICVAVFKYRSGEINYYNADATWHTLLTIEAYNETPISEHLFLPIVSLGSQDDKYIPWGATIPDENGNYYYTSFSVAGYFFPWLFMKTFRLPELTDMFGGSNERFLIDIQSIKDGKLGAFGYQLADLTDKNWTNGYSKKVIHFYVTGKMIC